MLCPCGCGETIHLRFMGERRPRWSLGSLSGRATVFPSIWRQAALTLPHPLDRASYFGVASRPRDGQKTSNAKISLVVFLLPGVETFFEKPWLDRKDTRLNSR